MMLKNARIITDRQYLYHFLSMRANNSNSVLTPSSIIVSGFVLVPKLLVSQVKEKGPGSWNASICELANHYAEDFPLKFKLKAEMDIYETFWMKEDERLTNEDIPGNYYYSKFFNPPPPPPPPPPLIKLSINVVRKKICHHLQIFIFGFRTSCFEFSNFLTFTQ